MLSRSGRRTRFASHYTQPQDEDESTATEERVWDGGMGGPEADYNPEAYKAAGARLRVCTVKTLYYVQTLFVVNLFTSLTRARIFTRGSGSSGSGCSSSSSSSSRGQAGSMTEVIQSQAAEARNEKIKRCSENTVVSCH